MRRKIKKVIWITTCVGVLILVGCGKDVNTASRNIAVTEINGSAEVTSAAETLAAYVGEQLQSGDMVDVFADSDMTLQLDGDKHLYAGQNTHFAIEATGKTGATKTVVALDEGSTLIGIENKLGSDESFEVSTPNSTMSVRGTTFKVEVAYDAEGVPTTTVEVIKGEVEVKASSGGVEQTYGITDGKYIVLHGNNGDVTMTGSGDSSSSGDSSASDDPSVSSASSSDDEWEEYYANPKEGYFFATGTAYYFNEYYADVAEEVGKEHDEYGGAGMVVVFDQPQDYNGEMIDKCCFLFSDVNMLPGERQEEWDGVHMEFYGFWGEDYVEQTDYYDYTLEAQGNLHTFYAYRHRPVDGGTTAGSEQENKTNAEIEVPQEYLDLTAGYESDVIMPVTDTYIIEVIDSYTDRYGAGKDVYMLSFDENDKPIMGGRAHSGSSEWADVLYKKHTEYVDIYEDLHRTGDTVYIKYIPDKTEKYSDTDTSNFTLKHWYETFEQNLDPGDEIIYLYCSKPLE